MINYNGIVEGIENGLLAMKHSNIPVEEFTKRLNRFKSFSYKGLSDDEIFWILTYVMFFNIGKKASMIEKKLPMLKKYLYGFKNMAQLSDSELNEIVTYTGFGLQINRCRENARKFSNIISEYGSFEKYLAKAFGITGTDCSTDKINRLYQDLIIRFQGSGIGETARWHFITELGFHSLKPDSVIKRIFYRLGLITDEQSNIETINVGREFSRQLNLPMRYIDIIFVKFGQEGSSDLLCTVDGICLNNNPKCSICPLSMICKYKGYIANEKKVTQIPVKYRESTLKVEPEVDKPESNTIAPIGFSTPQEFQNSSYYKGLSSNCKRLISKLFEKMISANIDFYVEKRKRNDFVLVAASRVHASSKKNILTVWTFNNSIDIRVMPDPQEHYYSEMDFNEEFFEKVKMKYFQIR